MDNNNLNQNGTEKISKWVSKINKQDGKQFADFVIKFQNGANVPTKQDIDIFVQFINKYYQVMGINQQDAKVIIQKALSYENSLQTPEENQQNQNQVKTVEDSLENTKATSSQVLKALAKGIKSGKIVDDRKKQEAIKLSNILNRI